MRRLSVFFAACLFAVVLSAAQKESQTIPLDRGGSDDRAQRKKKRDQTLREQRLRGGKRVKDTQARDRTSIKLPAAVINIEDLSHMEVTRGRGVGSLIPKVDRKDFLKDGQPSDYRDRRNGKKQGGDGGQNGMRTLSQMEITYGSFNALGALVMTGMERKLFSYQVSFHRSRDEGFSRSGNRVANSSSGSDDLLLDIGWSRDRFESGVTLRFNEKTTALQANTNFSQSKNTGVQLSWKGSYIFSAAGSYRFNIGINGDRFVLDNPTDQQTVSSLGFKIGNSLNFTWAGRSFLRIGLSLLYQSMDSDSSSDVQLKDPVLEVKGGFGVGVFALAAGAEVHLPGFATPLVAPFARLTFQANRVFSLYFLVKRDIKWEDHERMLMDRPYAAFTSLEDPENRLRIGGGGKLKLGAFVLNFGLFYLDYTRYFAPEENSAGLFVLTPLSPGMLKLSAEARVFLYRSLSLHFGYTQLFLEKMVPYLPELLFTATMEWRVPGLKTVVTARGRFEGSRNDGALDPYLMLDLGVRQPVVRGLSAVFMVRNLLNSDMQRRFHYAEPGISLHAGVNLRF